MPLNPLDALKKAEGIREAPSAWQEAAQRGINGSVEGLRGLLASFIPGVDVPDSTAGRVGELAGAAVPFGGPLRQAAKGAVIGRGLSGPHPAIRALMDTLSGAPDAIQPLKVLAGDKVGGWTPRPSKIQVPSGFELPDEAIPFMNRDPDLTSRWQQEQGRFKQKAPTSSARRDNRGSAAPMVVRKGAYKETPSGYDSKFALSGYADDMKLLRKR